MRLALATLPDLNIRLYDLFLTNTTTKQGIYAIKLYVRGIPFVVSIDDMFLFESNVTKPSSIEMWSPLLSKAWAKIKGSFMAPEILDLSAGLRMTTGAPV
jgi:hypothetical protein